MRANRLCFTPFKTLSSVNRKVLNQFTNKTQLGFLVSGDIPLLWPKARNFKAATNLTHLCTRSLFATARAACEDPVNINSKTEDELDISECLGALFSNDEREQVKAAKSIAEMLLLPPTLPDEVHADILDPELDKSRKLWSSLFDEAEDGKSAATVTSDDWAARAQAAAASGEDEEDAVVGASLTFGEIDFDAMATLFRAVRALGGLRDAGGTFWDLGAGPGRPALAAALLHDFDTVRGIELQEPAFARARRALDAFERANRGGRRTKVPALASRAGNIPARLPDLIQACPRSESS